MKEYKVINPSLGFRNHIPKLEDLLNTHGREGWEVKSIIDNGHGSVCMIVFERDKNR